MATTEFQHYTVLAEGIAGNHGEGFTCPAGNAIMGMKVWASSAEEAGYMVRAIGNQIGFTVTGDIQIYDTEPTQPPRENPRAYDINFTPFASERGVLSE
jgi:hypothetical protein